MKKTIRDIVAFLAIAVVVVFLAALCYKEWDVAAYSFVASLVILPLWAVVHLLVDNPDWTTGGNTPCGFGG